MKNHATQYAVSALHTIKRVFHPIKNSEIKTKQNNTIANHQNQLPKHKTVFFPHRSETYFLLLTTD